MKLRDYLTKNNLDVRAFSKLSDIGEQNIYYWLRGKYKPHKFYRALIKKATKGQVLPEDWDT